MGRFQGKNVDEDDAACVDGSTADAAASDAKKYQTYFAGGNVTKWSAMWHNRIPGRSRPEERQRGNPEASRYTNLCSADASDPWLWFLKHDGFMRSLDIGVGNYELLLDDSPHLAGIRAQTLFSLRRDDLL